MELQPIAPGTVRFMLPQGEVHGWLQWHERADVRLRSAIAEGPESNLQVFRNERPWVSIHCGLLLVNQDDSLTTVTAVPADPPAPFRQVVERINGLLHQMAVRPQDSAARDLEIWTRMIEPAPRTFAYTYRTYVDLGDDASLYVRIWAVADRGWVCSYEISQRPAGWKR